MTSVTNTQNGRIGNSMMIHTSIRVLCVSALLLSCSTGLLPAEDQPATKLVKSLILPGESFLVDGRPAFILWPPEEKRPKSQSWIMYAPTLPGLPDRHEKWMHEQFVAAGVAVAGIDIGESHGTERGLCSDAARRDSVMSPSPVASRLDNRLRRLACLAPPSARTTLPAQQRQS